MRCTWQQSAAKGNNLNKAVALLSSGAVTATVAEVQAGEDRAIAEHYTLVDKRYTLAAVRMQVQCH
jgi:hypothetical protein